MTLLTLVENAVRHGIDPSEDGGRIDVQVRLRGDRCRVRVTDTGVGLQSTGDGLGTGLRRCASGCSWHSAATREVRVTEIEPHGVCAELDFPAREAAAHDAPRPTALIADDEPLLRDALERLLARRLAGAADRRAGTQRPRGGRPVRGTAARRLFSRRAHARA